MDRESWLDGTKIGWEIIEPPCWTRQRGSTLSPYRAVFSIRPSHVISCDSGAGKREPEAVWFSATWKSERSVKCVPRSAAWRTRVASPSCCPILTCITLDFLVLFVCFFGTSVGAIDCFKCVSVDGSNPACEDPFHNNFTSDMLESPCMGGRKNRNGLFPATACLKLSGVYGTRPAFTNRCCHWRSRWDLFMPTAGERDAGEGRQKLYDKPNWVRWLCESCHWPGTSGIRVVCQKGVAAS